MPFFYEGQYAVVVTSEDMHAGTGSNNKEKMDASIRINRNDSIWLMHVIYTFRGVLYT